MDGRLHDAGEACLPADDHGLLYGDGVFEGIRVHGGRVFRLDDHLDRLSASAAAIGLERAPDRAALRDCIAETVRATGLVDVYVRLIVTRGSGPLGVDPTRCPRPRLICIAAAVDLYDRAALERGLALVTVGVRRDPSAAVDPRVKSLNYLGSVLAKREARLRGADEALLLNAAGAVAEASVANLFIVREGSLATPPVTDGALDGITRRTVLELAREAGIPTRVSSLGRIDVLHADEAFLTGTAARVIGVRSLDGHALRHAAPGPWTAELSKAYLERVRTTSRPLPGCVNSPEEGDGAAPAPRAAARTATV